MLLCEIIDLQTKFNDVNLNFDMDRMAKVRAGIRRQNRGQPGYGAFSKGIQDPKDPNMYYKRGHVPYNVEDDAYYLYIQAAAPYMDENPYLPRVYKCEVKRDLSGNTWPRYKMEKLQPLNVLKRQQIVDMMRSILPDYEYFEWDPFDQLFTAIWTEYESPNSVDMDPKLRQVVNIVRDVIDKSQNIPGRIKPMRLDMKDANFMVRMEGNRPQLVVTDPIC